jgi:hypothetical protein
MIQLDPAAHANAFAGELFYIEARLPELLHVIRGNGDREVVAIIRAEIDIRPVLWRKRHWI